MFTFNTTEVKFKEFIIELNNNMTKYIRIEMRIYTQ